MGCLHGERIQRHGAVRRICGRTGWFVDAVELHLRSGEICAHGSGSGEAHHEEELHPDEYICAVGQRNFHVGFLGSALTFYLSSRREITFEGTCGNKKVRDVTKFDALVGEQVFDVKFDRSRLDRICITGINKKV